MEKMSKKVFAIALIAMIVMMFNLKVNAATYDAQGYLVLDEETTNTTTEEQNKETTKTTTEENKTTETTGTTTNNQDKKTTTENYANTATTAHSQAGSFENAMFIIVGSVVLVLMGIGYIKLKKYNF